ncbi:hypothetical protein DPMN_175350 [Dreissena polymorpha]|uniref:Uncharacterized protein n=1 Tax=Dreissena polymorpha TaxID=45954 RepID=A0A9D4E7Q1_DREPO|nr:hypothetical protein DPMN_175350 [Dreissena polymorpha]
METLITKRRWPCTEDGQRFHSESGTPMDPRRQNKARETQADLETHSGRGNKSATTRGRP